MGTDVGTGVTGVRAGVQWADAGRMGGTERGVLRGLWDGGDLSNLPCLVGDQPSCHHHCPPPQKVEGRTARGRRAPRALLGSSGSRPVCFGERLRRSRPVLCCPGDQLLDAQTPYPQGRGEQRAGPRGAAHSPLHPINVSHPDHFKERKDHEVQRRSIVVENLQPVVS